MSIATELFGSAVLATVGGKRVSLIEGLESAWFGARLVGRAFTVRGRAGDNLAMHRALADVSPGQVIVAELVGQGRGGHWGELMTIAAQARGVAGIIVNGTVRDRAEFAERRFPVFHRGTCPRPAAKKAPGVLSVAIRIGGVVVHPGDLIAADDDGIVVVPKNEVERLCADGAVLVKREEAIAARLARGETTIRVLGLDAGSRSGSVRRKEKP